MWPTMVGRRLDLSLRGVARGVAAALCLGGLAWGAPLAAQRWTLRMEPVVRIGVQDGDPNREFGIIQDVALDRAGNVYVLDGYTRSVSVFTRAGRFVGRLGRSGRGPGEFFIPIALAVDSLDRLYVLDQGNARVSVFTAGRGGRAFTGSFPIDFQGFDLCADRQRLYVLGARRGRMVHAYTPEGRWLGSFGAVPGGAEPLMVATLNGGALECRGGGVFFLPQLLGDLRVYSSRDGRLAWSASIAGYNPARLNRNSDGSITLRMGRNGSHDLGSGTVDVGGGYMLVQVGTLTPHAVNRTEFREVRSYVASPRNVLLRLPGALPRVLTARDGYALAVRSDPFPSVSVYRLQTWKEGARP